MPPQALIIMIIFKIVSRALVTELTGVRRGFARIWARRLKSGPITPASMQELNAALNNKRENAAC
jgi:hypothetical protein